MKFFIILWITIAKVRCKLNRHLLIWRLQSRNMNRTDSERIEIILLLKRLSVITVGEFIACLLFFDVPCLFLFAILIYWPSFWNSAQTLLSFFGVCCYYYSFSCTLSFKNISFPYKCRSRNNWIELNSI